MFKKKYLGLAIAATLAAGSAQAALETSVVLKNETARFIKDGIRTGEATSSTDTTGAGKETFKFENTAKIFLNDELDNGMSWHGELNIVRDTKAIDGYDGHETNTQKDWLRELYVDTTAGDWDLRLGKQQVVWGTADGIKLLDMVNPTDWSEFNQNAPADARIPVWMINAEKYLDNGANIQFIASEAAGHKIAGLNASGDSGHPFIMKGVDSITGKVNGFLNVSPALAKVATTFVTVEDQGGFGGATTYGLVPFTSMTVDYFAATTWDVGTNGYLVTATAGGANTTAQSTTMDSYTAEDGFVLLNIMANSGGNALSGLGYAGDADLQNNDVTNLTSRPTSSTTQWAISNPKSAFEYMYNATFATFNTFAGNDESNLSGAAVDNDAHGAMTSTYVKDYPNEAKANLGFRFKNTTSTGLNYSVNFMNHYDSNPYVDISYHDASDGEELTTEIRGGTAALSATAFGGGYYFPDGDVLSRTSSSLNTGGNANVLLKNSAGEYYGAALPVPGGTLSSNGVEMRYTEKLNRINSLGGSFDFAIDTDSNPVVIRGEFLYDKDTMQPVVDKRLLSIGDLEGALTPQKADMFKYVIGADTTVMTDMMVSGQFIQFRNLDYVNESRTCTTQLSASVACNKYTADAATLSLTNGLNQAEENKEFYSLFLSKPFGDSGEGRWNNIFIYEEGGGKWNRFDVEYGFDDQLIGTFEVNKYFGDENTMFGQFENASNIQVGIKYLLQ